MTEISRRAFAYGAGAIAVTSLASARPVEAAPSRLSDIDHIVIMMQENRSFDHYFGSLRGVRGFGDRSELFSQPDPFNPERRALPFHLDTKTTSAQMLHSTDHSWLVQHDVLNGGQMNNWLVAHRVMDRDGAGPLTMGYHVRDDIPFYYALADAFTICDGYFCSVLGPTHPNRYYLMTGTCDPTGRLGSGPSIDNRAYRDGAIYGWETYPERLERAGVSWRVYHDQDWYGINVLKYFKQIEAMPERSAIRDAAMRNRAMDEMLNDFRTGNFPQVTWICPPGNFTEHPDYLPAAGEHFTSQVLRALMSNPKVWAKTAFILTYDENDGLFDHIVPPTPPPGTADEYIGGLPVGLGFRVPTIIVSPFTTGGYVCSETFDHTSVLRFIEIRFGVEVANLSAWRRRTCGDLTAAFGFGSPPRLAISALPPTAAALERAEQAAYTLPKPAVPRNPPMPQQEPGTRPRRGKAAS